MITKVCSDFRVPLKAIHQEDFTFLDQFAKKYKPSMKCF